MRSINTPAKLFAVAALIAAAAGVATVDIVRAAPPATAPAAKPENAGDHIQHLRAIRRTLNDTMDALKAEETLDDKGGHRPAALKALETARDAVNSEIVEFEKATGKK